jgi:hypothetical protein
MSEIGSSQQAENAPMTGMPEIIDLREPTGFEWLELSYSHSPEELAKNAALTAVLLLDQTEQVIIIGKDAPFMGEPSQVFLDKLLGALADEQSRSGYAQLFHAYSSHLGGPHPDDSARLQLMGLVERKNKHLLNFNDMDYMVREQNQERLRHDINHLRQAAINYLMTEHTNLDDLDQALLWEFEHRNETLAYS